MHPETLSVGRQTSAQTAKLYLSDQFICLSLIALLAAFFFLFVAPKFEASLRHEPSRHTASRPIDHMANTLGADPLRAHITLAQAEVSEEPADDEAAPISSDEADLSSSDLIDRWQPYIEEASERFSIPQNWIRAVIRIESGGRTQLLGQPITSAAGAMGVMQLMQQTYDEMRERHDLGPNPYNVRDNILAGTAYLRELYTRFGYPRLFAAYNAGPGRLLSGGSLPAETRAYLGGVVKQISKTCVTPGRDSGSRKRGSTPASDCRPKLRA